jgi:hypothetical protein
MSRRWMPAPAATPCEANPNCVGIQAGEWAWFMDDGRALHTIGFCKDADGKGILPRFDACR